MILNNMNGNYSVWPEEVEFEVFSGATHPKTPQKLIFNKKLYE